MLLPPLSRSNAIRTRRTTNCLLLYSEILRIWIAIQRISFISSAGAPFDTQFFFRNVYINQLISRRILRCIFACDQSKYENLWFVNCNLGALRIRTLINICELVLPFDKTEKFIRRRDQLESYDRIDYAMLACVELLLFLSKRNRNGIETDTPIACEEIEWWSEPRETGTARRNTATNENGMVVSSTIHPAADCAYSMRAGWYQVVV